MRSRFAQPQNTAQAPPPPLSYPLWAPEPLPRRGDIRTDGRTFADYLPLSPRDLAPWRIRTADGHSLPPVVHRAVYAEGWRTIGNLYVPAQPTAATSPPVAQPPAAHPREIASPSGQDLRVFCVGDALPPELRAAVDRHGDMWSARDWDGSLITWSELLRLNGPLVEVPTGQLVARVQQAMAQPRRG
jgi:hypothetical protein